MSLKITYHVRSDTLRKTRSGALRFIKKYEHLIPPNKDIFRRSFSSPDTLYLRNKREK